MNSLTSSVKMYESDLSADQRRNFGILSAVGCLILFAGIALYMISGADGLGTVIISITFLLTLLSSVFVLIGGIIRLIIRNKKNNEITKRQLIWGFGITTFGALAAGISALLSAVADLLWHCETGVFLIAQCMMCAGGFLCFLFGLKLFHQQ